MAASRKSIPTDALAAHVAAFLTERAPDGPLTVGLSGGCDSVVLLHLAVKLGLRDRLCAIHVHHGLSPNADRWMAFCEAYCRQLGVPLFCHFATVDRDNPLGLEAAARMARYRVFETIPSGALLLGHHRDDQAETVLFNLLRGAGVSGAAGMLPERPFGALRILRPMIATPRAAIEAYARAQELAWIEDESNADTGFSRNFLRHKVFPLLHGRFPAASRNLAKSAAHFAEADTLLGELAALDWARCASDTGLRVADLRLLSLPRLKNLLRWRLAQLGWRVPASTRLDEFCRQLRQAGPDRHPALDLPDGCMIVVHRELRWRPTG